MDDILQTIRRTSSAAGISITTGPLTTTLQNVHVSPKVVTR